MNRVGIAILVALSQVTGCATITRGTSQAWSVQTEPAGANARLSTGEECTTPCTLKLKRKSEFSVTISKEGYKELVTQVVSQIAGAGAAGMAGNVLVGGIVGVGVDAFSGATKELKPNPLVVTLEQMSPASIAKAAPQPETTAAQGDATQEGPGLVH
jgi:PEGA domain